MLSKHYICGITHVMNEIRYAILIGVNHYNPKPLRFSVKDVAKMAHLLQAHCSFLQENIHRLTSTADAPIENLYAELLLIIDEIKKHFIAGRDTVTFYFSGHGNHIDGTLLEFGQQSIPLQQCYELINKLQPKNQVYIIDACHSGHGLELKGNEEIKDELDTYYRAKAMQLSTGTYVMCSSKIGETSMGLPVLDGGMYTHYLLQAARNKALFDSDFNALSLGAMHEYAARKIFLEHSEYQQTPFYFSSSSGYYAFALKADANFIANCTTSIDITNEDEAVTALEEADFNMNEQFKADFSQFLGELVLNLYRHNGSRLVNLKAYENTIEIHDHSNIPYDPFTATPTANGNGLKVYQEFLKRYQGKLETSYHPGKPNIIRLSFGPDIFSGQSADPCHIIVQENFINRFFPLDQINFDKSCPEIIIDISRTRFMLSFASNIFKSLLALTEPHQLIFLKMHQDDLLRKHTTEMLQNSPEFQRIAVI